MMYEIRRWGRIISLVILLVGLIVTSIIWFFGDAMTDWRDETIEQGVPTPAVTSPKNPTRMPAAPIDNSTYQ